MTIRSLMSNKTFGSLNSAIRFGERQRIYYRVQDQRHTPEAAPQHDNRERKHSDGMKDAMSAIVLR
jgi:hypothetical protein